MSKPLIATLVLASVCLATTLRVPQEYLTIQNALDSVQNGDTVLIALGTYAEALHTPACDFVMKGDVIPQPGDYPRPVIDPSTLPASRALACLRVFAPSHPVLEDLVFRNGPLMFPRNGEAIGGIYCTTDLITVRRCIFDSTFKGIGPLTGTKILEHCQFRNTGYYCVYNDQLGAPLIASDCLFTGGEGGWALVRCQDASQITRCQFGGNATCTSLWILGSGGYSVTDCVFGPNLPSEASVEHILTTRSYGLIEGNMFTNLYLGNSTVRIEPICPDTVIVRRNHFRNNWGVMGQGGPAISCSGSGSIGLCTIIEDNLIEAGQSLYTKAMTVSSGALLRRNHFRNLLPFNEWPTVYIGSPDVEMHSNTFDSTYVAIWAIGLNEQDTIDARWNWWGDSTGPYNDFFNPNGHGDIIVGDQVNFIPWLRDTNNTTGETSSPFVPLPKAATLKVFPNPFNTQTRIAITISEPGIYYVDLFDILGRNVIRLFQGPVADEKEIIFDASQLTSGVYFAQVTNIRKMPIAATKLVMLK